MAKKQKDAEAGAVAVMEPTPVAEPTPLAVAEPTPPATRFFKVQIGSCPPMTVPAETAEAAAALYRQAFFLGSHHSASVTEVWND